jgi:hypothetical protein
MLRRASSLVTPLLLATAIAASAQSFVLDGGDVGAAPQAEGSCPSPWLAESQAAPPIEASASVASSSLPSEDPSAGPQAAAPAAARPKAFEYSDGYRTRLKIHKYASYAMLPLFIAQYVVGQKLYNGNVSDSTRSVHSALALSTAVLFGVNTVTGVWNLSEGRKDPNHRTKRMVHGSLMLLADAGFVATGMTAPGHKHQQGFTVSGSSASTHRSIALASMGVATAAYVMMLF